MFVEMSILCHLTKNAPKKIKQRTSPSALPLRSRRLFKSRRGSFLHGNKTPKEHGFLRLVDFSVYVRFIINVWFLYHLPHDGSTKRFAGSAAPTDGGGQGGGRVRRMPMNSFMGVRSSSHSLWHSPCYFLSTRTESNIKKSRRRNVDSLGVFCLQFANVLFKMRYSVVLS